MIKTNCENCVFVNETQEACVFDIPNSIKQYKNIVKNNNYNSIENYKCAYTLSRSVYDELLNNNHTHEQIVEYIIANVKIKYYLVVILDDNKENIPKLCENINRLCVKPKFVSFINRNLNDDKVMADTINSNLDHDINWKLHNMIVGLSDQKCMTICMDTNFNQSGASIFCVYNQKIHGNNYKLLDSRIYFLHMCMIVQQRHCHAVIENLESIDGLAMSFNAYKLLILNQNNDILKAIRQENETIPNFKYITYEYCD